jgi:hypothetical protein
MTAIHFVLFVMAKSFVCMLVGLLLEPQADRLSGEARQIMPAAPGDGPVELVADCPRAR